MQTFDGKDLYPGLEEKPARLLYFLVENRRFVEGNKRIVGWCAAMFTDGPIGRAMGLIN